MTNPLPGSNGWMREERLRLLEEYAATSRAFADAVERLRHTGADGEAFIRALADAGTAHRTCERTRIRLDKHLADRQFPRRHP